MSNIIAIVQARMDSTRLPEKVMLKVNGRTILDYVIDRLELCRMLDDIVVTVPSTQKDDLIVKRLKRRNCNYSRAPAGNVLWEYCVAARYYNADTIVRITADNPLIDPVIVDKIVSEHLNNKVDYTSNVIKKTFPIGLYAEAFNFNTLEMTQKCATTKYDIFNVTPFIYNNPDMFRLRNIEANGKLRRPDVRVTLDTKADFDTIKKILEHFTNIDFTSEMVIDYYDKIKEE